MSTSRGTGEGQRQAGESWQNQSMGPKSERKVPGALLMLWSLSSLIQTGPESLQNLSPIQSLSQSALELKSLKKEQLPLVQPHIQLGSPASGCAVRAEREPPGKIPVIPIRLHTTWTHVIQRPELLRLKGAVFRRISQLQLWIYHAARSTQDGHITRPKDD